MINQNYYNEYSGLTQMVSTICRAHKNVNSFGIGENDDYSVNGEDHYPRVFFELPVQGQYSTNMITWSFALTITQQTKLEREDEQEKINNCYNICNDIIEGIKDFDNSGYTAMTTNKYFVEPNYSIITLTRFKDDFTAGVRLEINISQVIPVNLCEISSSFDFNNLAPIE